MYENATYEVILQRMLDNVLPTMDKREGSVIWDAHSPTAIEFQILYLELDNILKEAYGDTASREFLIRRCKEQGIAPHEATHAILKGVFTPNTLEIPLGSKFSVGDLNYIVTGKIADGEYEVQCETAGIAGNQYFGTMIPVDYVNRLETAELTEVLIPGEDEEETETLRQRYFSSFDQKAFGGNRQDYIDKTNAIAGVGSTKVTAVWNSDIRPADMIPSKKVIMWYEGIVGTLDEEVALWLSSVYMAAYEKKLTIGGTVLLTILNSEFNQASSTLVSTVQETIDPQDMTGEGGGLAPIGHVVSVKTADIVQIVVSTTLTFESGYGWSNLQSLIDSAVEQYLIELRKEWADNNYLMVRISQIENRIFAITGVLDIASTKINGEESNLTLDTYEIPVFGGVSE